MTPRIDKTMIMSDNYTSFSGKGGKKEYEMFMREYLKRLGLSYARIANDPSAKTAAGQCHDKPKLMQKLRDDMGDCKRCHLHKTRTNLVFGVGSPCSDILFIGEAPGEDEDLKGEPFVGRAGKLLDRILESIGLSRAENVYIANILKSRPPGNKISEHMDAIEHCLPFLIRQIEIIAPKLIVCLGTVAAHAVLRIKEPITKMRGHCYDWNGIKVIPTYHPSYLLRNPIAKKEVWDDCKKIQSLLNTLREDENV